MSYAGLTREDRNGVKRWLHRRRFCDALRLARGGSDPGLVIDYGGGDGAFALLLAERFPLARVICFEPVARLRAEAEDALSGSRVEIVAEEEGLPSGRADVVFCLEVLEHLPRQPRLRALREIGRVMSADGRLICGVPVEIGPPAVAKGLFRMSRRFGAFDARPGPVMAAAAGRPPRRRRGDDIDAGRAYLPHHLGFDHRRLVTELRAEFRIERLAGSPLPGAPIWLNSELHIVARRGGKT